MSKLQDLTEKTTLADDDWLYGFDPDAGTKDVKMSGGADGAGMGAGAAALG